MSPLARSLRWLRDHGYDADVAEKWIPHTKIRKDLFGFIDVMAVSEHHLLAIQCSHADRHADHVKKVMASDLARRLVYHMDIEVWSWALRGARGKPKRWTLRRDALTAKLLPKRSLLRAKIESGEWPMHTLD